jgi:hypothetical protein
MLKIFRLILPVFALFLIGLACQALPSLSGDDDSTPTPAPSATPANFAEILEHAVRQVQETGTVTVQVTEAQISQFLQLELLNQPELPFSNPQIFFRDGKVEFLADVEQSGLTATMKVILAVDIDENGQPFFQVESASLGLLPLPQDVMVVVEDTVNQMLGSQILANAQGVVIQDIRVGEGFMEITLQLDPQQ